MPFKSEKQRKWMFANKPKLAKKWAKKENIKQETRVQSLIKKMVEANEYTKQAAEEVRDLEVYNAMLNGTVKTLSDENSELNGELEGLEKEIEKKDEERQEDMEEASRAAKEEVEVARKRLEEDMVERVSTMDKREQDIEKREKLLKESELKFNKETGPVDQPDDPSDTGEGCHQNVCKKCIDIYKTREEIIKREVTLKKAALAKAGEENTKLNQEIENLTGEQEKLMSINSRIQEQIEILQSQYGADELEKSLLEAENKEASDCLDRIEHQVDILKIQNRIGIE